MYDEHLLNRTELKGLILAVMESYDMYCMDNDRERRALADAVTNIVLRYAAIIDGGTL